MVVGCVRVINDSNIFNGIIASILDGGDKDVRVRIKWYSIGVVNQNNSF